MKKKIFFASLLCLLVLPLAAAAADKPLFLSRVTSTTAEADASASSTVKGIKGAISHCPIIASKIQLKVTAFDNAKMKHLAVYNGLQASLDKIVAGLSARGSDVAILQADTAVLDQKISKFNADYASYISQLKIGQDYVCGQAQGQFLAQLKTAQTGLMWVLRDATDIRNYYLTTVKKEINRLKALLDGNATSTPEVVPPTVISSTPPAKPLAPRIKPLAPPLPKL